VNRRLTVTNVLILINIFAYAYEYLSGTNFENNQSLVDHGALWAPLVTHDGQWWRVVTGAFLHGGLAHIALNMYSLYILGRYVELIVGPWRMLAIYTIALFGGGYAIVYFAPNDVTVGASGAIFGLFGALIAIGVRLGKRGRALITQMLPVLLINLAFTFAVPFISKAGHVGGLLSGFVAGLIIFTPRPAPAAPIVTDTATGQTAEAELLEPETPRA